MKAPDKIYVNIGPRQSLIARAGRTLNSDIEYIRKDALLEWAKETKAELEKQNVIKDDIRKGAIWELEEVINKINSL